MPGSTTEESLDLRGLKCPLPALLAKKALARLGAGATLCVLADDPMSVVDIPHMCHGEGHAVESVTPRDGFNEFILKKTL
jgi:tRNA 2-thiouridine synthesizing protein A